MMAAMRQLNYIRTRLSSIYEGWWVLAGATLFALISGGILYHGRVVFFNPIRRDLNLSSASASLIFTVANAQTSLAAPLYGWLADRVGPRPLIAIGGILAGVGMIVMTRIDGYLAFLFVYLILVSVPSSFGFGQTLLTAVNGWFVRRKAIALTILLTGFAAGGALFVYPLGLGVENIGWRSTAIYAGILVISTGVLFSRVVRRPPTGAVSPAEAERPEPDSPDAGNRAAFRERNFTLAEALRNKQFWILLAASTLRISAENGVAVHIIPIMVWQGADEGFAAGLVSVYFLLSIPFRLLLGVAGYRFPFQPLIIGGILSAIVGCLLLIQTDGLASLYPFVVLLAIYEGAVVLQWVAIGSYFGRRNYGAITGIMRAFDTIGTFLAPWYAGWMFDRYESYTPTLITFIVAWTIAAALFAISRRPNQVR